MSEHTIHAQLAKRGWSVTYIGAVSYMKLVSITDTLVASPNPSRRAIGTSRWCSAVSMFAYLSPRFDPSAMATV